MIHGISIFLQMTTLEHSQQKICLPFWFSWDICPTSSWWSIWPPLPQWWIPALLWLMTPLVEEICVCPLIDRTACYITGNKENRTVQPFPFILSNIIVKYFSTWAGHKIFVIISAHCHLTACVTLFKSIMHQYITSQQALHSTTSFISFIY